MVGIVSTALSLQQSVIPALRRFAFRNLLLRPSVRNLWNDWLQWSVVLLRRNDVATINTINVADDEATELLGSE